VFSVTLVGFYASLLYSSARLSADEEFLTEDAIRYIEERGFPDEAFLLKRLAVYRSNDNWLNASVEKENAFAATNFPFGIITLYPDFFAIPSDRIERAAILLHEVRHVKGGDEKEAYEFVWRNRTKLGWTADKYGTSEIWTIVSKQTREYVPQMFICEMNVGNDCTAGPRGPLDFKKK
jgi:hypothetical protein